MFCLFVLSKWYSRRALGLIGFILQWGVGVCVCAISHSGL